jgi:murein L,D-transpeptidase YafK
VKFIVALLIAMLVATKARAQLKTVEDRITEYGATVQQRLEPQFRAAGVPYPPAKLTMIGIKQERVLEIHAASADGIFRLICTYPILAASGVLGPKLKEGDRQVPEGVYRVPLLNPNSDFHLSIRLDYPNEFERAKGAEERRTDLGTDIMIHGDARSRGCLAMGDPASEDLFVLAALTGIENVKVILTPVDFRKQPDFAPPKGSPSWTGELYEIIKRELAPYTVRRHAQ